MAATKNDAIAAFGAATRVATLYSILNWDLCISDSLYHIREAACLTAHDVDRLIFDSSMQVGCRQREGRLANSSISIDENLPTRGMKCPINCRQRLFASKQSISGFDRVRERQIQQESASDRLRAHSG
jgi:hypothetical protein